MNSRTVQFLVILLTQAIYVYLFIYGFFQIDFIRILVYIIQQPLNIKRCLSILYALIEKRINKEKVIIICQN